MFILLTVLLLIIGFAGGFITAIVMLCEDITDDDNCAEFYDPEEFK